MLRTLLSGEEEEESSQEQQLFVPTTRHNRQVKSSHRDSVCSDQGTYARIGKVLTIIGTLHLFLALSYVLRGTSDSLVTL
ncbi:unnamed protein product [Allacma fusca]|uniref:Uncharacterized protein n=1 Tax=Allacma fusca TaxID=39272 RepID=A0A8J2KBH0_9HEXA|nr:unnamed protein product [Allacma fusca]